MADPVMSPVQQDSSRSGRWMPPGGEQRVKGFWANLRATLLTGLLIFLPVGVTVWVLNLLDSPFRDLFHSIAKWFGLGTDIGKLFEMLSSLPGVGLIVGLILIFMLGLLARNYLGHFLIQWFDDVAKRIPLIRTIYSGTKQLSDTVFTAAGKESFRRAVLVHFPGESSYAIGFVTGEARGPAQLATNETVINVFVPTTPNPTSGFLLMLPAEKMIPLDVAVEDALKMVISGGIYVPPPKAEPGAAARTPISTAAGRTGASGHPGL